LTGSSAGDANMGSSPDEVPHRTNGVHGVELAIGYLGIALVLIYPIGLAISWLQLLDSYSVPTALYATSLLPTTVVVGSKVVAILAWSFVAGVLAALSAAIMVDYHLKQEERHTASRGGWWGYIKRHKQLVISGLGIGILLPLAAFYPFFSLHSVLDYVLYVSYLIAAMVGGAVRGWLEGQRDSVETLAWRRVAGIAALFGGVILGAICLAGIEELSLPSAEFSAGAHVDKGSLLSHADGYWYVLDGEGSLLAIPDDEAGEVRIPGQ
jgi:hypothetical protein